MLTDERILELFNEWFRREKGGDTYADCWNACARAIEAEVMAEVCSAQNSEYAPQDGLPLTDATQQGAQEPVGMLYRFNEECWHFTSDTLEQFDLEPGTTLETKEVFCRSQPPAPCPKCATPKGFCLLSEYDALQVKVAEQSAEIERLTNERDEYNSAWQRSGVEYRKLRDSLLSLAGAFK